MGRRDKKPSKFGKTSEERMEHFRKKITKDFGDMTIRNREHLAELMRDRGYRKFKDRKQEEHYGYPTTEQKQLAWDELQGTPSKTEVLETGYSFSIDKFKNHHATYSFKYGKTTYRKGQFIPKKFR